MSETSTYADLKSGGCTCLRLRKAARRVSLMYDQHLEPFGLTITQYGLLAHLKAFSDISIGGLADKLIMDPTTLTRNFRPLEARGFITLGRDPNDKRTRILNLTESGRAAVDAAKPAWAEAQAQINAVLGAEDGPALSGSIDRMLERLS